MQKFRHHLAIRSLLFLTLTFHLAGFLQLIGPVYQEGILFISRKWAIFSLGITSLIILEFILFILCWTKTVNWVEDKLNLVAQKLVILGWFNIVIYALSVAVLTYLVYGVSWGLVPPGSLIIIAIFWSVSLAGCLLLKSWCKPDHPLSRISWGGYLAISVLLSAFTYRISSFFPDINTYPFTLTWSETSRYYYASLFFGSQLYGFVIPPTVLHPSRYLMQAIPFLLPGSSLWLHRVWQVILWLGISVFTSLVIVNRLTIKNILWKWLSSLWIFLFLLVGPVYYHLQVPVILICLGFNRTSLKSRRTRILLSIFSLLIASIWAGISRVNWFPVPGLLAAALWLAEVPLVRSHDPDAEYSPRHSLRDIFAYLSKPVFLFLLSMSLAFLSQALYILWSGNPAGEFTSSFSSGLLWYRMWPNPTFRLGILPGILLLSLPLILLTWLRLRDHRFWRSIHIIRLSGMGAILFVLFIAGIIVSIKIGGGSNLHNMDSFMVVLLVISASFFFRRVPADQFTAKEIPHGSDQQPLTTLEITHIVLGFALAIVVLFSIFGRAPISALPDTKAVDKAIKEIERNIEKAEQTGGDILFISNRHLITFKEINSVKLVPEYERVYLMEMAMAENSTYLERFHNDLREHRFSLIVSEPLFLRQKDENEIFGEENNAWVQNVSRYVLCYYNVKNRAREVGIQFFTPNSQSGDCP